MSMIIDKNSNELIFVVPNSESPLEAQHNGIVDRTVGSFYMSENFGDCYEFLNGFKGDFYLDIGHTISNVRNFLKRLKDDDLSNSFKKCLRPQFEALEALMWYQKQEKCNYYLLEPPTVNKQHKYLKMDNLDQIFKIVKSFLLGDISQLIFKKIGTNGFLIYVDCSDDFESKINSGLIMQWRSIDFN